MILLLSGMVTGVKIIGVIFIAFMIVVAILGFREKRKEKSKALEAIKARFGSKEHNGKSRKINTCYYDLKKDDGFILDDITSGDVDLDSLFTYADRCFSLPGKAVLFDKLKRPKLLSEEEKNSFNDSVLTFQDEKLRDEVSYELYKLGDNKGKDPLKYFSLPDINKNGVTVFWFLLAVYIIAVALLFFFTGIGIVLLIFNICISILLYFKEKAGIYTYIEPAFYLLRLLLTGTSVSDILSRYEYNGCIKEDIENLKKSEKALKKAFSGSSYVFLSSEKNKNIFSVIIEYINMLFHIDIIIFYFINKNIIDKKDDFLVLFEAVGNIDVYISVLSMRKSLSSYCVPRFNDENKIIAMYHPLLEGAVKNHCYLKKGLLVTGSNASGKSTFLKTVAVNMIFAQSLATVFSETYDMPPVHLYTSMKLSDNLSAGDSFFMAEIKSIKRMMDAADKMFENKEIKVACFVDEIFKGTNTIERVAASSQIIRKMSELDVIFAAASHDTELTELLAPYITNVHFEEDCAGDDIKFTYRLLDGPAKTTNALKLLKQLGYSDDITSKAFVMTENFEKTGKWAMAD